MSKSGLETAHPRRTFFSSNSPRSFCEDTERLTTDSPILSIYGTIVFIYGGERFLFTRDLDLEVLANTERIHRETHP
jgi:hypothetical protein